MTEEIRFIILSRLRKRSNYELILRTPLIKPFWHTPRRFIDRLAANSQSYLQKTIGRRFAGEGQKGLSKKCVRPFLAYLYEEAAPPIISLQR